MLKYLKIGKEMVEMGGKRGRRAEPIRGITVKRIKELRREKGETQQELALAMGYEDKQVVGHWERGDRGPDEQTLYRLARHFNVVPEYLTGGTDIKDPVQYFAALDAAMSEAEREFYEARRAELVRMESLFQKCGFLYEDLSCTALFDFGDLMAAENTDPDILRATREGRSLRLVDLARPDRPPTYFKPAEMEELLAELHDAISFVCYQQRERCEQEVFHDGDD